MWYCVYFIHTHTFNILSAFLFQNLSKMLKIAATHCEITTKSKYQLIIKNVC